MGRAAAVPPLTDLRLGMKDEVTRLEIVCAGPCRVLEGRGGRFILDGASGDVSRKLAQFGTVVGEIKLTPHPIGSVLEIGTVAPVDEIVIAACGPTRICLDLHSEEKVLFGALMDRKLALREGASEARITPVEPPAAVPVAAPKLAEAPVLAQPALVASKAPAPLQPSETKRPVTPKVAAVPAPPKPKPGLPQQDIAVFRELIDGVRDVAVPAPSGWQGALAADLSRVSPAPVTPAGCVLAEDVLQTTPDNMALFSYTAFCAAAAGNAPEARLRLGRVQQLYPDDQSLGAARKIIDRSAPVPQPGLRGAGAVQAGLRGL